MYRPVDLDLFLLRERREGLIQGIPGARQPQTRQTTVMFDNHHRRRGFCGNLFRDVPKQDLIDQALLRGTYQYQIIFLARLRDARYHAG